MVVLAVITVVSMGATGSPRHIARHTAPGAAKSSTSATAASPLGAQPTFSDPQQLVPGSFPTDVAAAPLDQTGAVDLVASIWGGGLATWLNPGNGVFAQAPTSTTPSAGGNSTGVATGLVRGVRDVFVSNGTANVGFYENNLDGTFNTPTAIPTCNGANGITTGNFGNNATDFAISTDCGASLGTPQVQVFAGDNAGHFAPSGGGSCDGTMIGCYGAGGGIYGSPGPITTADLNRDNLPDLITETDCAALSSPTLSWLDGSAGADSSGSVQFVGGGSVGQCFSSSTAGQFDDTANSATPLQIAALSSNTTPVNIDVFPSDNPSNPTVTPTTLNSANGVTAADFNNDGNLDLAITSDSDQTQTGSVVDVMLGNGDGTFTQGPRLAIAGPSTNVQAGHIITADFNGDGNPDLALSSRLGGSVFVFLNTSPVLLAHGLMDSHDVNATFAGGAICEEEINLPCISSDFSDYTLDFSVQWDAWWNPSTQAVYYTFPKYTVIVRAPGAAGKIYTVFASADVNDSKAADLLPVNPGPSSHLPDLYFYRGEARDATEYSASNPVTVMLRGGLDIGWDVEAGARPPSLPQIRFKFSAISAIGASARSSATTGSQPEPPPPPPPTQLPTRYVASTTTFVPKPGCVRLPSGSITCRSSKLPRVTIDGVVTAGVGRAILQVASSEDLAATSRTVKRSAVSLVVFRHFFFLRAKHVAASISKRAVLRFATAQLDFYKTHARLVRISGLVIPKGETPRQFFFSKQQRDADRLFMAERLVISSITKGAKTATDRSRDLRTWFARQTHHHVVRVSGVGRFKLVARLPSKLIY